MLNTRGLVITLALMLAAACAMEERTVDPTGTSDRPTSVPSAEDGDDAMDERSAPSPPVSNPPRFDGTDSGPYCAFLTGENFDDSRFEEVGIEPAAARTFFENPLGLLSTTDPTLVQAVFELGVQLFRESDELAPEEIRGFAELRTEQFEAIVSVFNEVDWDAEELIGDNELQARLTTLAGDLRYVEAAAEISFYSREVCGTRSAQLDQQAAATPVRDVPDNLRPAFDYVSIRARMDFDGLAEMTVPGSPAELYSAFNSASLEHTGVQFPAARVILLGADVYACDGMVCEVHTAFDLSEDGLVKTYTINGEPLENLLAEPTTATSSSLQIDLLGAYVTTGNNLQILADLTYKGSNSVELLALDSSYTPTGEDPKSFTGQIPLPLTLSPSGGARVLLGTESPVTLPGSLELAFSNGERVQLELTSLSARSGG